MYEKEDVLNREEFINKVINLIRTITENNKSCSFAIDGQWGSGHHSKSWGCILL